MAVNRQTIITVDGEPHTIEQWVNFHPERELTVSYILDRIKKGMEPERAVTQPRKTRHGHRKDENMVLKAREDIESYIAPKKEVIPEYEWRYVPVSSRAGEYRKVQIN